jgi:hypothetical protein
MVNSTKPPAVSQKPSLSSLNFQIALHYNALFSVLFAVVIGACSIEKVRLSLVDIIMVHSTLGLNE